MGRWTAKPPYGTPIDRGHPWTQAQAAFFPLNEAAGPFAFDLARANTASLAGTFTFGDYPVGTCPVFSAGSTYIRVPYQPYLDYSAGVPFTAGVWWYNRGGTGAGGNGLIAQQRSSPSAYSGWMLWQTNFANQVGIHANGANRVSVSSLSVGWHHLAVVYDTIKYYLYVDGVNRANSGAYATPPNNAANDVIIGGYYNNGNDTGVVPPAANSYAGPLNCVHFHGRALSSGELAAIGATPGAIWQVFAPRDDSPKAYLSAAGATTTVYFGDISSGFDGSLYLPLAGDIPSGSDRSLVLPYDVGSGSVGESSLGGALVGDTGSGPDRVRTLGYGGESGSTPDGWVRLAMGGEAGNAPSVSSWASSLILGDSSALASAGLSRSILGDSGAGSSAEHTTQIQLGTVGLDDALAAEAWTIVVVSAIPRAYWFAPGAARLVPIDRMDPDAFEVDPFAARLVVLAAMDPDSFEVDPYAARVITP